jgi:hypothetical protein
MALTHLMRTPGFIADLLESIRIIAYQNVGIYRFQDRF